MAADPDASDADFLRQLAGEGYFEGSDPDAAACRDRLYAIAERLEALDDSEDIPF